MTAYLRPKRTRPALGRIHKAGLRNKYLEDVLGASEFNIAGWNMTIKLTSKSSLGQLACANFAEVKPLAASNLPFKTKQIWMCVG